MSNLGDKPFYPSESASNYANGATIREVYAGMAMCAILSKGNIYTIESIAMLACQHADALIKALSEEGK